MTAGAAVTGPLAGQDQQLSCALSLLEQYLSDLCDGDSPDVSRQTRRVILAGGKRLRPRLAWLCGQLGGASTQRLLPLMAILELMHTASLIHDDVVDDAAERRGEATIQTVLGEQAAVQCGDFLLARAMELLHIYQDTEIGPAIARTFTQMCRGELAQAAAAERPAGQTVVGYFRRMRAKTACLISTCCKTGALAAGLEGAPVQALARYGLHLGMAFQLRDDLLDFAHPAHTGKPRGQDLRRGIRTLPVFYALEHDPQLAQALAAPVDGQAQGNELLARVCRSGGLAYTQRAVERSARAALAALSPLAHRPGAQTLADYADTLARPLPAAIFQTEDVTP
jgi:heptaprenyl diphosphate synthase